MSENGVRNAHVSDMVGRDDEGDDISYISKNRSTGADETDDDGRSKFVKRMQRNTQRLIDMNMLDEVGYEDEAKMTLEADMFDLERQ